MRYLLLVLLLLVGCTESALHRLPEITPEEIANDPDGVDILVVLDTSCSMREDWPIITYGLGRSMDDLAASTDVFGRATSACANDTTLYPFEDGWGLVETIPLVKTYGCGDEEGLEAALVKKGLGVYETGEPADAWADSRPDVIVFVSDEPDQSDITYLDFEDAWPVDWVTAVVGPDEDPPDHCDYERGDGYIPLADKVVSICTSSPWSVF